MASYHVRAEVEGYNAQTKTLTIIVNKTLQVTTYYDDIPTTRGAPVELGQAIADSGTFSLGDDPAVLTIPNLTDGMYEIHVGSEEGNYNRGSYSKGTNNGTLEVLKSELIALAHTFSFTDGAVIGIMGPDITRTQHVATYRPSNIYSHYDLQAMRVDLDRDYVLQNNIVFSLIAAGSSNYVAVGTEAEPFAGRLYGEGYSITGVQIKINSSNNY